MQDTPRRFSPALIASGVFLATLLLFARVIGFAFVNWDDGINVYHNPFYVSLTPASLAQFWYRPYNELFTPVTNTIWAFCAALSRLPQPVNIPGGGPSYFDARLFHALGALFHAGTAAITFFLLRRLTKSDTGATLGALLWAAHPLQVEAVAWVTGHNNVYCGFFGMLCLLLYTRAVQDERRADYVSASLCYVLALLGKPTAVALPLMIGALELFVFRRPVRRWLPLFLGWAAVAVALTLFTRASSTGSVGITVALWKRPIIALDAITFYFGKLINPLYLGVDYGRLPDRVVGHWWGYACAATTLVVFGAIFVLYRRGIRWPLIALALLVTGVFPMLGLVPYYFLRISTVADRYLYLAMLGPAFALASVVALAGKREERLATGGVSLVVLLLFVRTALQLPFWRDSETLFQHCVDVNPNSALSHNNLGIALADKSQYDRALEEAQKVTQLNTGNAESHNNLGVAYGEKGQREQAIAAFREAVKLNPDYAEAHYHLGITLADDDPGGAIPELQKAVRLKPSFTEAWYRLGVLLGKTGQEAEAIDALGKVEAQNPAQNDARYIRAVLLGNAKRNKESEAEFAEATRRQPGYVDAWVGLGTMRERLGDTAGAKTAFAEALKRDPQNAKARAALKRLR